MTIFVVSQTSMVCSWDQDSLGAAAVEELFALMYRVLIVAHADIERVALHATLQQRQRRVLL